MEAECERKGGKRCRDAINSERPVQLFRINSNMRPTTASLVKAHNTSSGLGCLGVGASVLATSFLLGQEKALEDTVLRTVPILVRSLRQTSAGSPCHRKQD